MNILITGATGFIGQHFVASLLKRQAATNVQITITCWVRDLKRAQKILGGTVSCIENLTDYQGETLDVVVNLAGAPIADKRWSKKRKQLLYDSRILTTRHLVDWLSQCQLQPSVFLSASAIGYYGYDSGKMTMDEASAVQQPGFSHQLCADWEKEAQACDSSETRVCLLRTGIVLGKGGALAKMSLPFRYYLGGHIATGKQWVSWISLDDQIRAMHFLIDNEASQGAYNLCHQEPVTNAHLSLTIAQTLKRPYWLHLPAAVAKVLLGKEGAAILNQGIKAAPKRLTAAGFTFNDSLHDVLSQVL